MADCKTCGAPLQGRQTMYCSQKCNARSHHEKKIAARTAACVRCGAKVADGRHKLCSVCRELGYRAVTGSRTLRGKGRHTCGWCGKSFGGYKKAYCSAECRASSKRPPSASVAALPGIARADKGNTCRYCGAPCLGRYCGPLHEHYGTHYLAIVGDALQLVPIRADGR